MAAPVAYMLDDTYKHHVHNPPRLDGTYNLPSRQLRQLFKNNQARPVAALQILVNRGAVDASAFSLGLGGTDAEAAIAEPSRAAAALAAIETALADATEVSSSGDAPEETSSILFNMFLELFLTCF